MSVTSTASVATLLGGMADEARPDDDRKMDAAKAGDQDRDRLATFELIITKGFGDIGRALKSIRQEKLYRDE